MTAILSLLLLSALSAFSAKKSEVRANDFGDPEREGTRALQAAIDSGASTILIDPGKPWVIDQIYFSNNQTLIFKPGVVVKSKKGSLTGMYDAMFNGIGISNLTLIGYGATVTMNKADYFKPPYVEAEWRHALNFRSVTRVQIKGFTLVGSGGDGVYLGVIKDGPQPYCKEVLIQDLVCDDHMRQGISVISAEDLVIRDCLLKNTIGAKDGPWSGIDFEPNESNERFVRVLVSNVTAEGNGGSGFDNALMGLQSHSVPVSITYMDCLVKNSRRYGISVAHHQGEAKRLTYATGTIDFIRCRVEGSGEGGLYIKNKALSGVTVRFIDCRLTDTANNSSHSPIWILIQKGMKEVCGGVHFERLVIEDRQARPFVKVRDDSPAGVGIRRLSGTLSVSNPYGISQGLGSNASDVTWRVVDSTPREKAGLVLKPLMGPAIRNSQATLRLRGGVEYHFLPIQAGKSMEIRLLYKKIGTDPDPLPVQVLSPTGASIKLGEAFSDREATFTYTPTIAGLHRLPLMAGDSLTTVKVQGGYFGVKALGPIHLFNTEGSLFIAPRPTAEGQKRILRVKGQNAEGVKVTVMASTGKSLYSGDDLREDTAISLDGPLPGGLLEVRFEKPGKAAFEDFFLDLGQGFFPWVSFSADNLLIPEEN
jgi:hypothetical protein